jgi:hypothetical protein
MVSPAQRKSQPKQNPDAGDRGSARAGPGGQPPATMNPCIPARAVVNLGTLKAVRRRRPVGALSSRHTSIRRRSRF